MQFSVGFFVILCSVAPGLCIECYRCNSTDLDCLEKFMYPNPLKSESCNDVFEARYCIKTTGIYDGVLGTRRFCSDEDMGNKCEFHQWDGRDYKGCIYTCQTDGCNTASSIAAFPAFIAIASCLAMLLKLKFDS